MDAKEHQEVTGMSQKLFARPLARVKVLKCQGKGLYWDKFWWQMYNYFPQTT